MMMKEEEKKERAGKVFYAELNDNGLINYPQSEVVQIDAGDTIIFHINSNSRIGNKPRLMINLPHYEEEKLLYKHSSARATLLKKPSKIKLDDSSDRMTRIDPKENTLGCSEFEVSFKYPGSFLYQIEFDDQKISTLNYTQPDWIVVHPKLRLKKGEIPIESISMQSVYGRCLGKLEQWFDILEPQSKIGYNALHFVPLQKYGSSGSMYSLKDQHSLDDLYFDNPEVSSEERIAALETVITQIREKQNMLCFVDIVLNHTATNSDWLVDHPEGAYNLVNCPYLQAAWEFDKFLAQFSEDYANKKIPNCPSAPYVSNEGDLQALLKALDSKIKNAGIEQYFLYNMEEMKKQVEEFMKNVASISFKEIKAETIDLVDYALRHSSGYGEKMYGVKMEINKVCAMILAKSSKDKGFSDVWKDIVGIINKCNEIWLKKVNEFMKEALKNIEGTVRYDKFELKNPKFSKSNPLVKRYFTEVKGGAATRNKDEFIVAHNGWTVENCDFASSSTFNYLRRNIVIWDDSVKLYYGKKREDSPYIWTHMEKYVGDMARIFQGLRIDNCHSTPIHVLEYYMSYARGINPNVFVFAELFTNSREADAMYTRRVGLNALIRESLYIDSAGSLAYKIKSIGGDGDQLYGKGTEVFSGEKRKLIKIYSKMPKEILYDCTHDNPSPIETWNSQAILPLACAIAMAKVPIGTTRGVDEFIPKNLSVIGERRLYRIPKDTQLDVVPDLEAEPKSVDIVANLSTEITFEGEGNHVVVLGSFNGWNTTSNPLNKVGGQTWKTTLSLPPGKYEYKFLVDGKNWLLGPGPTEKNKEGHINNILVIGERLPERASGKGMKVFEDLRAVRKIINKMHKKLGMTQSTLSSRCEGDVVIITRTPDESSSSEEAGCVLIARTAFKKFESIESEALSLSVPLPGKIGEVLLTCNLYIDPANIKGFVQDKAYVSGIKGQVYFHLGGSGLTHFAKVRSEGACDIIEFFKIPTSLCVLVTVKRSPKHAAILRELANVPEPNVANLSMSAINHVLFRCMNEENDISFGKRGIYDFGGLTPKYAGIAGIMREVISLDSKKDLFQNIVANIKAGNWLIDYHISRLANIPELSEVALWLKTHLGCIKDLPAELKPRWVFTIISKLFNAIWQSILDNSPDFFKMSQFNSLLLLSTYQFVGDIPSSTYRHFKETIAAGLPHFSVGYMRCWGRDTMIALRGLLLVERKFKEAKGILLMFASVMRHGLIPNLHDQGNNTRFNSRDASWFFMEALQEYVIRETEHGANIFKEEIEMQFLDNRIEEHLRKKAAGEKKIMTIADVVQEIMQAHARGIDFTEWNAGTSIDGHMTTPGFRVQIRFDPKTGFIFGGNKFNYGTWMDKLGSSDKAKNRGVPASPRDGCAVEILGLLRSALRFLDFAFNKGVYPYEGVTIEEGKKAMTFKQWAKLIDENFERHFLIPKEPQDWKDYVIESKLVNKKGIYKDIFGCSNPSSDYQLRPNFTIAMAVAPEMFKPENAKYALSIVESSLFEKGILGLKTLDPSDKNYRGEYINDEDSANYSMAQGFSYHSGPEWVWPLGYFLRALIKFGDYKSLGALEEKVMTILEGHQQHIMTSPWMSLPEITDAHAKPNSFGCPAQAWSISTIIDALADLSEKKHLSST